MITKETEYMLPSIILKQGERKHLLQSECEWVLKLQESTKQVNFIHLTYTDVSEKILDEGFKVGDGNMGEGVYCCDMDNPKSIQALLNFYTDLTEGEDRMSIVIGTYTGTSYECIGVSKEHLDYNIGFVLLKDVTGIKIDRTIECSIDEIEGVLNTLMERAIKKFKLISREEYSGTIDWRADLYDTNVYYLVQGESILAELVLFVVEGYSIKVDNMQCRYSRQGIGRKCIEAVSQLAIENKCKKITGESVVEAVDFWFAMGAKFNDSIWNEYLEDDYFEDLIPFEIKVPMV